MTELYPRSATSLGQAIRMKDLTCAEVVEAFLCRIMQKNPKIDAIVTLDADGARRRAKDADAALARGENWGSLKPIDHHRNEIAARAVENPPFLTPRPEFPRALRCGAPPSRAIIRPP